MSTAPQPTCTAEYIGVMYTKKISALVSHRCALIPPAGTRRMSITPLEHPFPRFWARRSTYFFRTGPPNSRKFARWSPISGKPEFGYKGRLRSRPEFGLGSFGLGVWSCASGAGGGEVACAHTVAALRKNVCMPSKRCVCVKCLGSLGTCSACTARNIQLHACSPLLVWRGHRVRVHTCIAADNNMGAP